MQFLPELTYGIVDERQNGSNDHARAQSYDSVIILHAERCRRAFQPFSWPKWPGDIVKGHSSRLELFQIGAAFLGFSKNDQIGILEVLEKDCSYCCTTSSITTNKRVSSVLSHSGDISYSIFFFFIYRIIPIRARTFIRSTANWCLINTKMCEIA